ncbi:hypothetical protein [Desulforamulus ruminis]|uniref:Uncharacterized protein n=1 Tax=Desulforamulus ruminis (strain ATCC 23193 / DSM 2154 / NCIMB 8452 / DL) TaxID=696281 RepID=F6DQ01_DESRL|nr:hypothetical protein [Desulforamulus ruminis]AEG61945.1 hypothetical protein Desru_3745 [Desulforamulus ruminis DSM 2154]
MIHLGPFHGRNTHYTRHWIPSNGHILTGENEVILLKTLAACRVLSRNQMAELTGLNVRHSVTGLVKKGFLDEYRSDGAPPLYTLGVAGARVVKKRHSLYRTDELLRVTAANQLWIKMKKVWPGAAWDLEGSYPALLNGEQRFLVVAPRLIQGDNIYTLRAFNYIENKHRLFVVATSREHALEIARQSIPTNFVRYTWDALLKEGILFYLLEKQDLVPDTRFNPGS